MRSMTGRYCFHRCLSVNIWGGTLSRSGWWGYPILGGTPSQGGTQGTPSHFWMVGGTPSQGYPILGGTPNQVWMVGGTPVRSWQWAVPGVPSARSGWWGVPRYPPTSRPGQGAPPPWDGVPPIKTWLGYPPTPTLGWGTPATWDGVPPHHQDQVRVPHRPGMGTPPDRAA